MRALVVATVFALALCGCAASGPTAEDVNPLAISPEAQREARSLGLEQALAEQETQSVLFQFPTAPVSPALPTGTVSTIVVASCINEERGQGTLAREWDRQAPVDSALIAVGGGGLIGGAASWWAGQPTRVIGVEPAGSRALHAALAAGGPVDVTVDSVAADSLGARNVGQLVFDVCRPHVDHVVLVPDEAITLAQKTLWQDFRIASEPGGAAAFAAILCGAYVPAPGERVGILLCGGNVDLAKLVEIAA